MDDGFSHVPIIDISALVAGTGARHTAAARIGEACRECGFFYVVGHGVDEQLQQRLEELSRRFFAQDYMAAMTRLGHTLMAGIALSLGIEESYFADRYTADPLILFRIFNYPPAASLPGTEPRWGVAEHADYGVLTMLKQDDAGGLQVKSHSRWVDAPPLPGSFVCNIGDMLDRMTGGLYRSTPHRAQNRAPHDRLSFPFFFDPNFTAEVRPIDLGATHVVRDDRDERWDQASVHTFRGTYGDYLLGKVSKVFPELQRAVL